jgi:hypothetical protein
MQEKTHKKPGKVYGPQHVIARARWAPSGSATQTLTEAMGISSITRNSAGNYTVTLSETQKDFDVYVGLVENESAFHRVRVSSINQSAGTFVVIHETYTAPAMTVSAIIPDVSTASSVYVTAPMAGTVSYITSALGGPITVANSVVTSAIQPAAGGGFSAITNGTLTIAYSGSAAGDSDSATPTAANTVALGDTIRFTTDGGSTDAQTLKITAVITASGASDSCDQLCVLVVARAEN